MSAWSGLREEREVARRLARRIAGLFEQGLGGAGWQVWSQLARSQECSA
jgi:hypothetical protein